MGRRRKKVLRVMHRSLPKVFACPRCGMVTIRIVTSHDDVSGDEIYQVACGNTACNERREFRYTTKKAPIDVYNTFVDEFAKTGV